MTTEQTQFSLGPFFLNSFSALHITWQVGFFDNHWIVLLSPKQCKFLFFSPKPRWREEGLGTELELCQMTDPAFPTPFPDTELLGLIPSGVSEPVCKAEFCVSSPKLWTWHVTSPQWGAGILLSLTLRSWTSLKIKEKNHVLFPNKKETLIAVST